MKNVYGITKIGIEPLTSKHYATEVYFEFDNFNFCRVDVCGYTSNPSERELEGGWEPDFGMDHVESDLVYEVAQVIEKALKDHFGV